MLRGAKMLRGVLVPRVVAAAYVTAAEAEPQMHPAVAGLQTLGASPRRFGSHVTHLIEVPTLFSHDRMNVRALVSIGYQELHAGAPVKHKPA